MTLWQPGLTEPLTQHRLRVGLPEPGDAGDLDDGHRTLALRRSHSSSPVAACARSISDGDRGRPAAPFSCAWIHKPADRRRPMCGQSGTAASGDSQRPEQRPGAGGRSGDIAEACSRDTARWSIEMLEELAERCFRGASPTLRGRATHPMGGDPLPGTLASQPAAYSCESMAKTGDTSRLSPKGRLTITSSPADSGGELLAMEAQYAPGGSPPPEHYHPTQRGDVHRCQRD